MSTVVASTGRVACPASSLARQPRRTARTVRRRAVLVHAVSVARPNIKTPAGVTLPRALPEVPPPQFGFVDFAERINSRAAMIGFFALLLVEAVAGKGLLELVGFATGNGLGFEL